MVRSTPPGWGADQLTSFFDISRRNQCSAYAMSSSTFTDLVETTELLSVFSECARLPQGLIKWFIVRSGFSFKSAAAMLSCGDFSSAYALSRVTLERACYAYYFSRDKELLKLWIHREESSNERKAYDRKFKMKTILHVMEKNPDIPKSVRTLYSDSNELGAHASGYEFVSNSILSPEKDRINFVHLHEPRGKSFLSAADHVIRCGLSVFCIGNEIFKVGLINNSVARANILAQKYAY